MRKLLATILISALGIAAFARNTLRVDYVFCGGPKAQEQAQGGVRTQAAIYLDRMHEVGPWWGRSVNLDKMPPVKGSGSIVMRDAEDGKVLYVNTFCTLFHEWLLTEEATRTSRSFENVFLLPMPDKKAEITVQLTNEKNEIIASLTHSVDPEDILLDRLVSAPKDRRTKPLLCSGSSTQKIDVVIVAEGYTKSESSKFFKQARAGADAIFAHGAFAAHKDAFNVTAVFLPSDQSGVSIPGEGVWRSTALGSNYNTFYMDRYLTTAHLNRLHDALCGIPYEHIIILANDRTYGGGGIYNSYTLTTAGNPMFLQVLAHEFGHSFGALGDEYGYDDMYTSWYPEGIEPWEENITTCVDFASKWQDMMGVQAPNGNCQPFKVGLYEGAGYQTKGAFRPVDECIMRVLKDKNGNHTTFCPVCTRAIARMVEFNCVD